ncbi:hypothetical protein F4802DRAFT_271175 [Xylaria palmicola]|nr:hypothetical protein F4802DRAFT_271175 [Xylaria palmicola]
MFALLNSLRSFLHGRSPAWPSQLLCILAPSWPASPRLAPYTHIMCIVPLTGSHESAYGHYRCDLGSVAASVRSSPAQAPSSRPSRAAPPAIHHTAITPSDGRFCAPTCTPLEALKQRRMLPITSCFTLRVCANRGLSPPLVHCLPMRSSGPPGQLHPSVF